MKEEKGMKEEEILEKALDILSEALDGKIVNPEALNVALSMTQQFFWSSVYNERLRKQKEVESLRHKWTDSIEEK